MIKIAHFILILCFFTFSFAADNLFKEFSAKPEANKVILSWVTSDESSVKYFLVKRSNDNQATFIELSKVNSKGAGYKYIYIDTNVFFKANGTVHYKIEAIDQNGQIVEVTPLGGGMVHPDITGLFKTWGAIKNIFR
jgi:hypothetical protein